MGREANDRLMTERVRILGHKFKFILGHASFFPLAVSPMLELDCCCYALDKNTTNQMASVLSLSLFHVLPFSNSLIFLPSRTLSHLQIIFTNHFTTQTEISGICISPPPFFFLPLEAVTDRKMSVAI